MPDNNTQRLARNTKKKLASAGFIDIVMARNAIDVLADPNEFAELVGIDKNALAEVLNDQEISVIDSLGKKYEALLHELGIYSVAQLSQCDPFALHDQLKRIAHKSSVGRLPNRATLEYWIEQAQAIYGAR